MRARICSAIVCGCLAGGLVELAAQPLAGAAPVRVGGNIKPPAKIRDVNPVYPQIAQSARVAGVVILEITISPDGAVTGARVLRGVPLLNDAALDAVKQWVYTPTLLNGTPVPVIMTVTVNFALSDMPNLAETPSGMVGPPPDAPSSGAPMAGATGTSGAGAADATSAADAASGTTNPYLIAPNRVGVISLGMAAPLLFRAVPSTQIRPIPRRTPRGLSTDIQIALEPGGPTALVANLVDGRVMHIDVRDNRFRTAEGFGVGTTLGELRRSDPQLRIVMCDRAPCAIMASRTAYAFELDATAATAVELMQVPDSAAVTGVLVAIPAPPASAPPPPNR